MLIKALLMVGIGVVALLFVRGHSTARHQAIRRVGVLGFVALAIASLLFPQTWQSAAGVLGVGRGTDLLLYATIVAFLGFMVSSYLRTRDLQRQVTVLSRRLALDEAAARAAAEATLAAQLAEAQAAAARAALSSRSTTTTSAAASAPLAPVVPPVGPMTQPATGAPVRRTVPAPRSVPAS
ncbi:hypothetical protein SAMN06264364_11760 [Quadrisphaera granulorum]|uniref:DUF2304 domain-containing protein n=1 Tax=Quadrisphaera granulorum TaxID=317664 RepID=A0A316A6E1_9ACTN|nr:hypothetical protein BXY45_11760 [Quadrisphaera granulorum]SZE97413.1 hypothetical protein SAMN06264364_11760 [Quadrisphaera granulorum]